GRAAGEQVRIGVRWSVGRTLRGHRSELVEWHVVDLEDEVVVGAGHVVGLVVGVVVRVVVVVVVAVVVVVVVVARRLRVGRGRYGRVGDRNRLRFGLRLRVGCR